jgi:prolyl-tRNA synthetase
LRWIRTPVCGFWQYDARILIHLRGTVSPLSLDENTFPRVVTVLDASIASSPSLFALHAQSSSKTLFLSGQDLAAYLKHLEKEELKLHVVDFDALKADAGAPTATGAAKPAAAQKEKEDAKIEGAVQVAIGVKKEVDFPAWYTNVRGRLERMRPAPW